MDYIIAACVVGSALMRASSLRAAPQVFGVVKFSVPPYISRNSGVDLMLA
jgi:hypothetical protein